MPPCATLASMHAMPITAFDTQCIALHADGASALVALHGAHVLSWIPADGRERLFLSKRTVFDGRAAIRGGIPVIFPQFGERGALRKHGFARNCGWRFMGVECGAAVFELRGDGDVHWPYPFVACLRIGLTATRLAVTLEIENTGDTAFAFTAALHTYLGVGDIAQVRVEGLQGCDYEDSANGGTLHRQSDYAVAFVDETDRIYSDVVAPLTLVDGAQRLGIEQQGFTDVVVWNPGARLASGIADLEAGDWQRFVCIEAAQAAQPVLLQAGEQWQGRQQLG